MHYLIQGNKLILKVNDDGSEIMWYSEELPTASPCGTDIFRVILDNGLEREISVLSKDQKGVVTSDNNGNLTLTYNSLTDETGQRYNISMKIRIENSDGALRFNTEVENRSDVRVNEVQCPFVTLSVIADKSTERDILYRPYGTGERLPNPIKSIRELNHSEYVMGDYEYVWRAGAYPYPLSMAWIGVESGGHFLYLGRHDEALRTCSLSVGSSARGKDDEMVMTVSHYIAAQKGETISCGEVVLTLMEGTWKDGADFYMKWASNYFHAPKVPEWVKNMTGWQRIILKHQFGKIFFTYNDLVKVYENGRKYGLDTLLVFGWWRGCFDNGYPVYEPDEALGGAEELKRAISEIHKLGGNVILYNNGVLLDVATDFYRQHGDEIEKKNMDGAPYIEFYPFADRGMMARSFGGHKSFSSACHASEKWKEKLIENAKIKLSFDPDSIFFDQLGGHLPRLCFNPNHKHGVRIDEDVPYKIENVKAVRNAIPADKCIGTENVLDAMASCFDFSHGCLNAGYKRFCFPSIFRYAFPDVVVTNRFAHDEKPIFRHELNYAFVNGLRFDVSIYRGRLIDVSGLPNYAEHLHKLIKLKEEYREFFYDGRFIGDDRSIEKPLFITANLFADQSGNRLLALWNESDSEYTICAYGRTFTIGANEIVLERI